MTWRNCHCCKEKATMLFSISLYSQHCSPTKIAKRRICDGCLMRLGIDTDKLAGAIFEPLDPILR